MTFALGARIRLGLTLLCFYILLVQARLHHSHTKYTLGKRDALTGSALATASWIWASGATTGNVAFLKTFTSSAGKIATSATISFTAVNAATLWVNGQPIGVSNDWTSAQVFSAALNASANTFSILAGNTGNSGAPPAGLLAAIQVQYSDGSASTVVSDSTWQVSTNIPSDFPTPADTSQFASAAVAASYGSGAWGTSVTLVSPDPNAPTLVGGTWIWSTSDGEYAAPAGTVGFRKNIVTPVGKSAQSATILLTADNTFALYVNGDYVGAPPYEADAVVESTAWGRAQQFNVGLDAASNIFTVIVTNFLNPTSGATSPAGLVASIRVLYADGSSDLVGTDPSWLNGPYTSVSAFIAAPDSALAASFNVAAVGAWPWGQLSGISNVLAAAGVPSAPFTSNIVSTANQSSSNPTEGTTGAGLSAGSNPQSQSRLASSLAGAPVASGPSGGPSGSAAASTAHLGNSVGSSTATGSAAAESSGSGTATITSLSSFPSATSASSTHDTPVAAIVGAIGSTLTLLVLGFAIFYWRRRRYPRLVRRHSQGSSMSPLANDAQSPVSLVVAPVLRSSTESTRSPDMAELRPQGVGMNPFSLTAQEQIPSTRLERENSIRDVSRDLTGGVVPDNVLIPKTATPQSTETHTPPQRSRSVSTSDVSATYDPLPPPSYTE